MGTRQYNSYQQLCRKTNSTKGKKTNLVVQIGTSTQTAHSRSSTQKKEKKNHHQRQTTTLHRQPLAVKDVKVKTPSSPLAMSLPTMIHTELACYQVGPAAVGRCEPCSPPAIGSACVAYQDDVPHRTRHCQAGLVTIARCKLPNQTHEKLPPTLTKPIPSTKIQARTL